MPFFAFFFLFFSFAQCLSHMTNVFPVLFWNVVSWCCLYYILLPVLPDWPDVFHLCLMSCPCSTAPSVSGAAVLCLSGLIVGLAVPPHSCPSCCGFCILIVSIFDSLCLTVAVVAVTIKDDFVLHGVISDVAVVKVTTEQFCRTSFSAKFLLKITVFL